MNTRIKKLRKTLDLTQRDFADRIGVKRNTVATYEMGRSAPSDAAISLICREFKVNEAWLRTGIGEMFSAAPSNALDKLAQDYNLSHGDYVFIEKFLKIKPEGRQIIMDFMLEFASAIASDDIATDKPAYGSLTHKERIAIASDIDAEVESYREELELEASQAEKSSASDESKGKKEA